MNFLVDPVYRLPYILVFVVMAADLALSVFGSAYIPSWIRSNQYLSLFYKIGKFWLYAIFFLVHTFINFFFSFCANYIGIY